MVKPCEPVVSGFDTLPPCDGRTDRQTDRLTGSRLSLRYALALLSVATAWEKHRTYDILAMCRKVFVSYIVKNARNQRRRQDWTYLYNNEQLLMTNKTSSVTQRYQYKLNRFNSHCYNPVAPAYPIWAYYAHGRQRRCQEDPVSLPSGRLEKTTRSSPHHVAQHHPTGSETTPPYTPRSSRFGSEPLSVEDDVDIWCYAI